MRAGFHRKLSGLWRAEFLSLKDFVRRAALISLVFLFAHLAGLRDFTSILNGTTGSVELGWRMSAFLGLTYIFLYLAFVLLVPILLLSAAMLSVWKRLLRQKAAGPQADNSAIAPPRTIAMVDP
jgi:hypothetical protein